MRYVDDYPIPGKHIVYNMDDYKDVLAVQAQMSVPSRREVYPRDWNTNPLGTYGAPLESTDGLIGEYGNLDKIVKPGELLDAIDEAHARKLYPYYYAEELGAFPDDEHVWNQDGIGYCWTWSFNAEFMNLWVILGLPKILFPPVANGYLVGWADRGNYLGDMLRGATNNGLIPMQGGEISDSSWPNVDINTTNRSRSFWEKYDHLRNDFRLDRSWELNCSGSDLSILCQMQSGLQVAAPLYIAHNYWGHALGIEALFRDERAPNGVTVGHRNSHGNKRLLILEGSRATPDESHALVSCQGSNIG